LTGVPTATATSGPLNLNGIYDVEISYFDERDGKGQIDILLNDKNGVVKDIRTIKLDQATSSDVPNEDIRDSFPIEDLAISSGDTISIRGTANGGEQARVDFISFSQDLDAESEMSMNSTSELL
jgi:hypothetical protein